MERSVINAATSLTSRRGRVYVVSGPSGVGKDLLLNELMAAPNAPHGVERIVTATTRPPRAGERDGVDYHFLTETEFRTRRDAGWFLESAEFAGELYGTPREPVDLLPVRGVDVILKIDTQGALTVRRTVREALLVFIVPPSIEALRRRLRGRGTDSEAAIEKRLADANREMETAGQYDMVVINEHISTAVDALRAIILADRHRVER